MTPKTIVFDLGGVLIDWNPRHLYRKLFAGDEVAMEHFLRTVTTQSWNERQDAGRPFAEGIALLKDAHPDHAELIDAFWERWDEMIGGPIEGTVVILKRLKDTGMPLYALTNWSGETFPWAQRNIEFLSWFDGIVVSGVEKIIKPDPRIFEILIKRFSLDPAATVYIDDVAGNVEVAKKAGFIGLHFTGAEKLTADLQAMGLLVHA